MGQNPDDTNGEDSNAADDGARTTEDDLRKLKYGEGEVETETETSEDDTTGSDDSDEEAEAGGEDDGKTDDGAKDDEADSQDDDSSEFVKELPNIKGDTVPEYARNLEATVFESNKEGKRLADENAELKRQLAEKTTGDTQGETDGTEVDLSNPVELYAKQQMDKDMETAFSNFQKDYPQAVPGTAEYAAFTNEVAIISRTIMESTKRIPDFSDLYNKAAVILGWEKQDPSPTGKEKLGMAVKGQAAVTKTTSAAKSVPKSKVTAEMIALNKKMYPGKSDEQIRKELEPHVKV